MSGESCAAVQWAPAAAPVGCCQPAGESGCTHCILMPPRPTAPRAGPRRRACGSGRRRRSARRRTSLRGGERACGAHGALSPRAVTLAPPLALASAPRLAPALLARTCSPVTRPQLSRHPVYGSCVAADQAGGSTSCHYVCQPGVRMCVTGESSKEYMVKQQGGQQAAGSGKQTQHRVLRVAAAAAVAIPHLLPLPLVRHLQQLEVGGRGSLVLRGGGRR